MLHSDIPSQGEIRALAAVEGRTCLSIYTPTEDDIQDPGKSRLEFSNQVKACLDKIDDRHERIAFEKPFEDLIGDESFWRYQARSLVVLATTDRVRTFRLPNRLESSATVGDRFYLKPLLRAVTFPQTAFVLALAEGSVRLVEVTADQPAVDVKVPGLPSDAASYAGVASLGRTAHGQVHGRVQGEEGRKLRVREYARAVDHELRTVLTGRDTPLILAAAEPTASIFRSVNSYNRLLDQGIPGNPEEMTDDQLATATRVVLDGFYSEQLARTRAEFDELRSKGRGQVEITDIARSATFGRIETLFVDIDGIVPGSVDPDSGAVTLAETDGSHAYGVVDEIARRALLTGARVLAVRADDIPEAVPVAAILRFAG
ncbi:hypothetical protein ERC79_10000 [Rhodococcus sp. ABRD24]|uniref:baeRF11 domain-containing protein n=1 Tax=Rhodococcus sp. ABRD24 TaxID=2507582 RepID=UPI00103C46E8|nr:hypothetical protein [Rhodococcus sp. ABRD24]QBJ96263.1 hypothetical protein ERC79_10000 [Rhodococcus sp. ABRD24]